MSLFSRFSPALPVLLSCMLISGAALADDALRLQDGVRVTAAGMTVYTFDKDVAGNGKSVCNSPCADSWPAVPAPAAASIAAPYSVVIRDDGAKQLAYQGKPLYVFKGDKAAGDRNGDNFKTIWHVVKD